MGKLREVLEKGVFMTVSKWEVNRIGLIDFWYYDDEEFQFLDGKLLLRGANGSGKSVTMQSFIPLLLDGNKASERLDPFGTKARKIENYLLEENDGREERIGYLYMEFKRADSDAFLTIGIGLRGRKNKKLDSWHFVITDGRRVGQDFFLYKDLADKITLSKIELRNRLGDGGEVIESQKEYMKMVNERIFGYETIEEYKELVDLLIQLRTPKLSKDFKPTVLNEILSNALPPLSEDDLRPMSEAIENMDNLKSRLDALKVSEKAADKIFAIYEKYNQSVLYEKAFNYKNKESEVKNNLRDVKDGEKKYEMLKVESLEAEAMSVDLKTEQSNLLLKKADLDDNDATKLKEKQIGLESSLEEQEKTLKSKEAGLSEKEMRRISMETRLKESKEKAEGYKKEVDETLADMDSFLDDLSFDEHEFMKAELEEGMEEPYNFLPIKNQVKGYLTHVVSGIELLQREGVESREFEKLQVESAKREREKSAVMRELDSVQEEEVKIKGELIEQFYQWERSNEELKIPPTAVTTFVSGVENFDEHCEYRHLYDEIWKIKNQRVEVLQREKVVSENALDCSEKILLEKEAELKEWMEKEDPEPPKSEAVQKNREALKKANIPFYPFYKLIDFSKNHTEQQANYIEEAMLNMGILDALVIPSNYEKQVLALDGGLCDNYLFSTQATLEGSSMTLIQIDEDIADMVLYQELSNLMGNIGTLREGNTFIDAHGNFGLGILKGTITREYKARYIGVKARAIFKREMLGKLEEEREALVEDRDKKALQVKSYNLSLEKIQEEFEKFPAGENLCLIIAMKAASILKIEGFTAQIEKLSEQIGVVYEAIKSLRIEIVAVSRKVFLEGKLSVFQEAGKQMQGYQEKIFSLENQHLSYVNAVESIKSVAQQIEDLDEDIDEFLYDIGKLEQRIKGLQGEIQHCEKQLSLTNYAQIKEELEFCLRRLSEIPDILEAAYKKQASLKTEAENLNRVTQSLKENLRKEECNLRALKRGFVEEYKLGYVKAFGADEQEEPIGTAKRVVQSLYNEEAKSVGEYLEALQRQFYGNLSELTEYGLFIKELFSSESWMAHEDLQGASQNLTFRRQVIYGIYQGKQVEFSALIQNLSDDIVIQGNLVRDSDRELFEDILANTISKKIRSKIYKSEDWVSKMNGLMDSMNTSSGLTLSLIWKKKRAEKEEQLDTRELVELLRKDAEIMEEVEFQKLSMHFHSKVEEARRILSDTGNEKSFHAIMRDILDYRKWFEFQLYFQKKGETKRELTNNAFFTLSGGEKAMAMYVPLFSAVVAKYQGARKDAPKLISLDEAFAGVDETNIRDMFRLMVELDFEFIINSQILWGDYDTVPSLAVYQLLRPENAKYVAVIPYTWNGSQRTQGIESK